MKSPKRIGSFAALAATLAAMLLAVTPGAAHDDDEGEGAPGRRGPRGTRCVDVRASIEVRFTTDGCTSPVGMCTAGEVRSRGGVLVGRSSFQATGLGGGVVGEASIVTPPAEPASTWSYSGELAIAGPLGTLELEDVGVFDTARGTFTEMNRVMGGTGIWRDATGDLFIYGHAHDDFGGFDGTIRGQVCIPRRW